MSCHLKSEFDLVCSKGSCSKLKVRQLHCNMRSDAGRTYIHLHQEFSKEVSLARLFFKPSDHNLALVQNRRHIWFSLFLASVVHEWTISLKIHAFDVPASKQSLLQRTYQTFWSLQTMSNFDLNRYIAHGFPLKSYTCNHEIIITVMQCNFQSFLRVSNLCT